jgi:uroporphyrinogen-III synthase
MRTVLVTRPEPGATRTAERLRALGFTPLLLPLTKIVPLDIKPPGGPFDAVAITSANALRHTPEIFLATLLDLPCFVVGEATGAIARSMGFRLVVAGDEGGASLAWKINVSLPAGARILYLTGRVRSPELEQTVERARHQIIPVECYDTVLTGYSADYLRDLFCGNPVDACVIYSRQGAEAFNELIRMRMISHLFEKTQFFCLSRSIAHVLSGNKNSAIRIAATPDETALLALLQS